MGIFGFIGAVVGAIVGTVVVAVTAVSVGVVAPAVVVGLGAGLLACATNFLGICPQHASTGSNSGGAPTTIVTPPAKTTTANNSGRSSTGSTRNTGNTICSSASANACGMHGTGTLVNGICNASVPSDNSCPAPVISDKGFYANPTLVRSGEQSTLYWNVTGATSCALAGGGISGLLSALSGNMLTGSITQKTTYTLTCQDGANGGPSTSASVTVNLDPAFQNQ